MTSASGAAVLVAEMIALLLGVTFGVTLLQRRLGDASIRGPLRGHRLRGGLPAGPHRGRGRHHPAPQAGAGPCRFARLGPTSADGTAVVTTPVALLVSTLRVSRSRTVGRMAGRGRACMAPSAGAIVALVIAGAGPEMPDSSRVESEARERSVHET